MPFFFDLFLKCLFHFFKVEAKEGIGIYKFLNLIFTPEIIFKALIIAENFLPEFIFRRY